MNWDKIMCLCKILSVQCIRDTTQAQSVGIEVCVSSKIFDIHSALKTKDCSSVL